MFFSLIRNRRSIRRYEKKPVETEKLEMLVEAALRSPSSMGSNPWVFIIVNERTVLERLSKAKPHGATFLKDAPLAMVVCADPAKSSVWIEDASIASIFIHLAAESMGLGSCWIQIRERMHSEVKRSDDYISEILDIPQHLKVEAMIAIGYPIEKKPPWSKKDLQYEKVFYGNYGKPYRG
jgi:nitroreductase